MKFGCAKIAKEHILQIHDRIKGYYNSNDSDKEEGYKTITGVRFGKGVFSREQIKEIAEHYE